MPEPLGVPAPTPNDVPDPGTSQPMEIPAGLPSELPSGPPGSNETTMRWSDGAAASGWKPLSAVPDQGDRSFSLPRHHA